MTDLVMTQTGAPLSRLEHWHSIDWPKCYKTVERLQARIVKATQEGRWNKVKSLQHLLTHSLSGKALAVRRVTESRGKRTSGVDNELWSSSQDKLKALHSLKRRGYKASPLRRVKIPKSNGSFRPLSIPTMKDRAMQALYKLALDPIAETRADKHSYGFRAKRSTADAIEQCYTLFSRRCGAQWILEADIKGCFDNINHDWLLQHTPMDKDVLRKWLKAGYVEKGAIDTTEGGTPQGGVISPLLANLTLDGLGTLLSEKYPMKISSRKPAHKVNFIRYADDFIITGRTKELLEREVIPIVKSFLSERGLWLSEAKTRITHIDEGFDFLGQTVRKYGGKLLIHPSKKSVKAFLKSIRVFVNRNKMMKHSILIEALNPRIRGWCQYHRHVVSSKTFAKTRHELWKILWKWARRRHPNKNAQWVKDKYFHHDGKRDWCFSAQVKDPKTGHIKRCSLYDPTRIPIRRHVKIKAECNPYDLSWKEYLKKRAKFKTAMKLRRKPKTGMVWNKQKGQCPICNQLLTMETDWDIHHVIPKSKGGDGTLANLKLLHLNCHKQVHSPKGVNL